MGHLRNLFLNHVAQTSEAPMMFEPSYADGSFIFDEAGKAYIDLIGGISVCGVGHSHPKVVQAVKEQAEKYMHLMVYGEFVQSPQVLLADALTKLLPPSLNSVYFVNSGNEAIDGAMKLAKRITGRPCIACFELAYHGSGHAALSLNGSEYFKSAYRPLLPGIRTLRANRREDFSMIDDQVAAVVVEIVRGESGAQVWEEGFLFELKQHCERMGVMLIADEIQCGMGRTGTLFAFEQEAIIPDILCLAKAFGGGMPLGAFISSRERMSLLSREPYLGHITTFGGHPVSCAAALASLKVIVEDHLVYGVKKKEQMFRALLKHPNISSISGRGLMLAVHLGSFERVQQVIQYGLREGFITDWFLFESSAIRIAPALNIPEAMIEKSCRMILNAL
jgi:acetylornithine/succinyldiaminopimelate/putrescine aminotransferase